jgi:FAD/FMN-containing dehydrogenase
MTEVDRRTFLARSGRLVAAAWLAPAWARGGEASAAVDPRLRSLARDVRGPVITPGDAAYGQARLVYNERFDAIHPLGIVQPSSVADVRAAVRWARKSDVRLAARSGGHSYAGYSTTAGLVVDLRRLGGIAFHKPSAMVTVAAGARIVDVEAALAAHGRAIPAGSCATVGIGGLTLGGGVGLASRRLGTTSDNLVSLGIVTADARYLTCSKTDHADLFWANRGGGGGNFGIVTHFVFRTHTVGDVSYFFAEWPWSRGADVVHAWQDFAPHAPDELFSICALQTGGTQPSVRCFGQYLGPESTLRTVLTPLTRVDGIRLSTGTSAYFDAQLRWAGCLGKAVAECHLAGETPRGTLTRASFRAKSDYVNEPLTPGAIATMRRWIERAQTVGFGSAALLLDSYGGAINRVPPAATAFVHRNALCSAQYLAYWYRPSGAAGAASWIRAFHAAMRPHVSGFAYQNYIDRDLWSWRHAYYGSNYERLREVKRAVDPDWFFRFPQAIEPAAR